MITGPQASLAALYAILADFEAPLVRAFCEKLPKTPAARALAPATLPACIWAEASLSTITPRAQNLAAALRADWAALHWQQSYGGRDFQQTFLDRYGWVELLGTRGHFESVEVAAYLLVLGPYIDYPRHAHDPEEIYIPLAGTASWWKGASGPTPQAPGHVIHHPKQVWHGTRVHGETLLALALWQGDNLAQKSQFKKSQIRT